MLPLPPSGVTLTHPVAVDEGQVGKAIVVGRATPDCVLEDCTTEAAGVDETLIGEAVKLSGAQADSRKKTTSKMEDRCLIFKETFFDIIIIPGVVIAYYEVCSGCCERPNFS